MLKTTCIYPIGSDTTVPWREWRAVITTVPAVFSWCRRHGCLPTRMPSGLSLPICRDPQFRPFATHLLRQTQSLPFFVFGGGSPLSRELFLAGLENATGVVNSDNRVVVHYSTDEALAAFRGHLVGLLENGIALNEARRELLALAAQCHLVGNPWK